MLTEKKVLLKYAQSMAYSYRWLTQALDDMAQEMVYVCREFGIQAARKAEATIHARILQLCVFPNSGIKYEGMTYCGSGSEVRILHIRQISMIYCAHNWIITIIAVWNNYQNPAKLKDIIQSR